MRIRHAGKEDVPRVIELWIAMMDLHRTIHPVFARREDGHVAFAEFVRENITSEDAAVIVAEDDGRVVGYTMARIQKAPPVLVRERYCEVFDISVDSECKRRGAGGALVEALRAWVVDRGVDRIVLNAAVGNEESVPFWRRMGFEEFLLVMAQDL
ncbi:MAG: hypothetical protein CMJ87_13185 [Planctomycetes bacterium]|jgi:ribosomal protein S18 acetylase RimI-like enzyme|nr:hypothetical protein [Planctomycetota bacterium]